MFILSFFLMTKGGATTFQPMPLEKLVEESSSAAEVQLKSKNTYMNKMGVIMTDFTFTVLESHNLGNSDLDGEFLKLSMVGGTLDGVTSYIDGAPEFEVGEKSFVLLKKIDSKIYLSNFTMGKYKIQENEGKTFYVSSVFPYDKELGKVSKEKMVDLVKLKFKVTRSPPADEYKTTTKEKTLFQKEASFEKREPAQEYPEDKASEDGVVAMWAFFALFMVSGITIWWKLRSGVSI